MHCRINISLYQKFLWHAGIGSRRDLRRGSAMTWQFESFSFVREYAVVCLPLPFNPTQISRSAATNTTIGIKCGKIRQARPSKDIRRSCPGRLQSALRPAPAELHASLPVGVRFPAPRLCGARCPAWRFRPCTGPMFPETRMPLKQTQSREEARDRTMVHGTSCLGECIE